MKARGNCCMEDEVPVAPASSRRILVRAAAVAGRSGVCSVFGPRSLTLARSAERMPVGAAYLGFGRTSGQRPARNTVTVSPDAEAPSATGFAYWSGAAYSFTASFGNLGPSPLSGSLPKHVHRA